MKIVTIVRTRNEEANISRFCEAYSWADKILVADGGSWDRTKEIASQYENVEIRDYKVFTTLDNGIQRTPHASHLNFMIDWAILGEGADWVIADDCDCFPNKFVKENARDILESTDKRYVYIPRLYLWKNEGHFPSLVKPNGGKDYVPSIWAFHRDTGFRYREDNADKREGHQEFVFPPPEDEILPLAPPYALLHCPWQSEEMVNYKLAFYRLSGQIKNMQHPLHFGGELEPLPVWAIE